MKENVLDWLCSSVNDATSAIVLTHNIDFLFLQSVLHARLSRCGNPKLTVFADTGCAAGTFRQQKPLLGDTLGRHYRVVPMDLGVGRRFHPKALFLSSPTKAALAVGSGNLTHGGLSANREIWTTFEADDDGGPALTAFREYLLRLLEYVPQRGPVQDEVAAAFDPAVHSWAATMPPPGRLFGTPSDTPLWTDISSLAGDEVQAITAYAPYYDPDGEALARIAAKFLSPISVLVQKGHVGLPGEAAQAQPSHVKFHSVDAVHGDKEPKSQFIHAKFIAFHRSGNTLLIAGSANLSRAALLANRSWGNAELVATTEVSRTQFDELIADLSLLADEPQFPEAPPNTDWEIEHAALRVLAARHVDGFLTVSYSASTETRELVAETETSQRLYPAGEHREGTVRFAALKCPRTVSLTALMGSGQELRSEPAWVDDESRLGVSVPERRIAGKLAEVSETGHFTAKALFEILQLLDQHVRLPVKGGSRAGSTVPEPDKQLGPYSTEDVFSDGFGKTSTPRSSSTHVASDVDDFLRAFGEYFNINPSSENDHTRTPVPPQDEEEREKEQDQSQRQQAAGIGADDRLRLRKRLLGVLDRVINAMGSDAFVLGRPPERLVADITAAWLLLRKGLVERFITAEDYGDISRRLWSALFFEENGGPGAIPRCLEQVAADGQAPTAAPSAKLSAVLVMWSQTDTSKSEHHKSWLEFASAIIASRIPWLVEGGAADNVKDELARLLRFFPVELSLERLMASWREWVRAGRALSEFGEAARARSAQQLALLVNNEFVNRGDILWQMGHFFVAEEWSRRDRSKASVRPFGDTATKKVVGSFLVPVASLLDARNRLQLREPVRAYLLGLIQRITESGASS